MCSLSFLTFVTEKDHKNNIKDVMKQLRWFTQLISIKGSDHPLAAWFYVSALFWPTDAFFFFQSLNYLLLFCSTEMAHRGLYECQTCHKGVTGVHSQEESDFLKQCTVSVFVDIPLSFKTWNIYSICIIKLPDHHRCTKLSVVTPSFEGNLSPFCMFYISDIVILHILKNAENLWKDLRIQKTIQKM